MAEATNMKPDWVARVVADNPISLLPNGNVRTCPVRLSFPHLLTPSKPTKEKPEGSYGSTLLFPFGIDDSVLRKAATEVVAASLPAALQPGGPRVFNPFKVVKAADDPNWQKGDPTDASEGYVRGALVLRCNSTAAILTVDQRLAPITDTARIYPGVWAICTIRPYWFSGDTNKGPTFGLQSVMIVADDVNLGGGAANPQADFAGVKIDASVNPAAAFGQGATAGAREVVDLFS